MEIIPPSEIYRDGQLPLEPPPSLQRAVQVFFVGVAAGRLGPMQKHRSMLIHPSKSTATHRKYYDWTNRLKGHWHRILLAAGEPDREELLNDFREAYADIARTCSDLPPFEEIQTKLPVAINQTAVTLVNSVDGREVPWQNGYSHILVGGEKLGRGYTVEGLTVTYMPRSPGGWTADTIQQRARFLGYHSEYLGYCRVYLHRDLHHVYAAYMAHEQDMRARLAEHRGRPLQEWRRLFYLDQRLAPTRRIVLSSPWIRAALANGWFAPRAPHISPEEGQHNARVLAQLDRLEFQSDKRYPRHRCAMAHLKEIYERVLVNLSYLYEHDALGLCTANCNLKTLLDRDETAPCLVYLMGGDRGDRTLRKGLIPQLFQGPSGSYPGDREVSHLEIPTLQVHVLRLREQDKVFEGVPAVAIRLPHHEAILVHDE
ncbi:MAG: Z1 domain-containing protein [Candidatus Entotheonellia bacterium]